MAGSTGSAEAVAGSGPGSTRSARPAAASSTGSAEGADAMLGDAGSEMSPSGLAAFQQTDNVSRVVNIANKLLGDAWLPLNGSWLTALPPAHPQ
jgi:hypothetical protein